MTARSATSVAFGIVSWTSRLSRTTLTFLTFLIARQLRLLLLFLFRALLVDLEASNTPAVAL